MEKKQSENETQELEERVIVEEKTIIERELISDEDKKILKNIGEDLQEHIFFHPRKLSDHPLYGPFDRTINVSYLAPPTPSRRLKGDIVISPHDFNDTIMYVLLPNEFLQKVDYIEAKDWGLTLRYKDRNIYIRYKIEEINKLSANSKGL